jgi:phosphonate transport system permease protein
MFLWSLTRIDWGSGLVQARGLASVGQFAVALLRVDLTPYVVSSALRASWVTVTYAFAGLSVALALGLPLGVIGSGVLARRIRSRTLSVLLGRFALASMRSVHELVWAWLFVASFGLSPIAAVLALAIPYGGILGRIFSELLQDVSGPPLRALRASGASEWQILLYGRFPMALPDLLSYTFYRLECGIRSAAIMSFVGLGGLGHQIQLALDDLAYERVWTFLLFLIVLVVLVDVWSTSVRRRITQ